MGLPTADNSETRTPPLCCSLRIEILVSSIVRAPLEATFTVVKAIWWEGSDAFVSSVSFSFIVTNQPASIGVPWLFCFCLGGMIPLQRGPHSSRLLFRNTNGLSGGVGVHLLLDSSA